MRPAPAEPSDAPSYFERLRLDAPRGRKRRPLRGRPAPRAARHVVREWRVGAVLMVPNAFWHISNPGSDDHPGVYLGAFAGEAIFLKGTDAAHVWPGDGRYRTLASSRINGLRKPTAFRLAEVRLSLRRAELMFPERWIGALTGDELRELQTELAYAGREAPALDV